MRRMIVVAMVAMFSMAGLSSSALAAKGAKAGGDNPRIERLKDQLTKLDLSDEQNKKISDILDDARTKVQAAMADAKSSGDREAAKEKIKPILRDTVQKITAELTPDQKTKFRAAMQEMREEHQQKDDSKKDGATTQPAA